MYEYKCIIERVVDGDTVDVSIDLGFGVWLHNERVRILGIDAPETRTRDLEEKAAGLDAKAFVAQLLPVGSEQVLISKAFEGKFGRILGDFSIYYPKEDRQSTLSEVMLLEGHATVYS